MFTTERMIEWGECDAAGVVFYPNYFKWMDGAFHAFSRSVGFDQSSLARDHGLAGTPLIESNCRFFAPARFYELLCVSARVEHVGATSLTLVYRFRIGDTYIAEGRETRGFVTRTGEGIGKAPIPDSIRAELEQHLV